MAVGRKIKKGLNFFPVDVDIFQDIKIRKLIRYASGNAIAIYLCLIAKIYKNGYYLKFDDDLYFIIAEETGINEEEIHINVEVMYNVGLFDKSMFEKFGIMTSKGIQERYQYVSDLSRRKSNVEKYNLISSEETPINAEEIAIDSEETIDTAEETAINSVKTTQSKQKQKVNETKLNQKEIGKEDLPSSILELKKLISKKTKTPLEKTFDDFLEMRKKIKKPATERAIELLKMNLEKLSNGDDNLKIKILEQSIVNSWQDIFPLKVNYTNQNQNGNHQKLKPNGAEPSKNLTSYGNL